ncbi:1-acyl-sn-glycerol-3-phosphate acyltransferase [Cytophagales bacterium WSM2-2]|nr:1-acyl-sn-glycerol-3-phosphate acyltransferase [Cytophagales bacterium WSM2-2]
MNAIRTLHTYYAVLVFTILFIVLFPFLLVPILFPSLFRLTGIINRWWAKLLFIFIFIPFQVEEKKRLDRKKNYIFCSNHFSYLDIPTMGLNPVNTIFVGKSAMEKVPLFGFMYRRLHITVDRESLRSRGNTMIASMKAIDEGKSLVIYPEGGMATKAAPQMVPFKDGAFRTAIEKQIPIVPVTIPHNWLILPDAIPMQLHWGKVKMLLHEPIETTGMTLDDVSHLKAKTFQIIESELKKQNG